MNESEEEVEDDSEGDGDGDEGEENEEEEEDGEAGSEKEEEARLTALEEQRMEGKVLGSSRTGRLGVSSGKEGQARGDGPREALGCLHPQASAPCSQQPRVMAGTVKVEDKQRLAQEEESEAKRLAIMMMKKRERYLYNKIMFGKRRKIREVSLCHPPEAPAVAAQVNFEADRPSSVQTPRWAFSRPFSDPASGAPTQPVRAPGLPSGL